MRPFLLKLAAKDIKLLPRHRQKKLWEKFEPKFWSVNQNFRWISLKVFFWCSSNLREAQESKKGFRSKIHFLLHRRPKKGFNVSLEGWSLSIKCLLKGQGVKNSTGFFHQLLYPVLNFADFSTWPDLLSKTRRQSYERFTTLYLQTCEYKSFWNHFLS